MVKMLNVFSGLCILAIVSFYIFAPIGIDGIQKILSLADSGNSNSILIIGFWILIYLIVTPFVWILMVHESDTT